jgi:predicted RND superfamily exporter protein
LSQRQTEAAIATIRKAVAMPQWHLRYGESYLITGEPVILNELSSSITRSVVLLLIGVALVMALTLGLVFHGRPRLLPLAVALLSTAITFGALAASGAQLSLGEVAVLPVLIGLAVDYAVQLQTRLEEGLEGGMDAQRSPRPRQHVPGRFSCLSSRRCQWCVLLHLCSCSAS